MSKLDTRSLKKEETDSQNNILIAVWWSAVIVYIAYITPTTWCCQPIQSKFRVKYALLSLYAALQDYADPRDNGKNLTVWWEGGTMLLMTPCGKTRKYVKGGENYFFPTEIINLPSAE